MKLVANYTPYSDLEAGAQQDLWGITCELTNIGTEDEPRMAFIVDASKEDAATLVECGRFQKMPKKGEELQ